MKKFACLAFGLMIAGGAAMAQSKVADEAAIRALEEKWDAATLKGDTVALNAIFADTFVSTNTDGKVRTKAEILAELKSGEIKYQIAKIEEMKVVLYGDTGIVFGRWRGKFVQKGKTVDVLERYTDTYVRQNGQWRCVASHGSAIK